MNKMIYRGLVGLLTCASIFSTSVSADSLTLSVGRGMSDTLIQSGSIASTETEGLFYTYDFESTSEFFDTEYQWLMEFGWYYLEGEHLGNSDAMDIVYAKPKLRFNGDGWHYDVGLGAAVFTQEHWEEISFSGDTMFALSFGIGTTFGEDDAWAVDLVYNHFSNGYTRSPNPGLDLMTVNVSYNF